MPNFPDITPLDLLAALASETPPSVLDIRLPEDQALDPARILTARALDYTDARGQIEAAQDGAVVVCHKGLKLSAGVTARLVAQGLRAQRLRGGHVGWTAMGLPTMDAEVSAIVLSLDATPQQVVTVWACLRFQSPQAELLEVPTADLAGVAARFDAVTPADLTPPAVPGLSRVMETTAMLEEALRALPRPSASFTILDTVYRGALKHPSVVECFESAAISASDAEAGQ